MASDTREQFLDTAEALFAERGFYGTSIAAIAGELGLTKQALLHHFGSKEKLYADVLRRISQQFEAIGDSIKAETGEPAIRLKSFLLRLYEDGAQSVRTRLLMRELLDNKRRADTAGTWYLKAFLKQLIALTQAVPGWSQASEAEALATVYQFLGAINYFGVSEPTLTGIFGATVYKKLNAAFPAQLEQLIDAALSARASTVAHA